MMQTQTQTTVEFGDSTESENLVEDFVANKNFAAAVEVQGWQTDNWYTHLDRESVLDDIHVCE